MTIALAAIAPAAFDGRLTSNADFLTLERMIERHGLAAVLSELVTLASMQAEADRAQGRRSRSRSFDKRANLDLRAMLLTQAADALARAEALSADAAAVTIDAPVG